MVHDGSVWRRACIGVIALVVAAACAAVVSARAGGTSHLTSQSSAANPSAELKRLYAGDYHQPPKSGPPAQQGKHVWWISCGQIFEACALETKGFQEAMKVMGWKTTVVDGKTDPEVTSNMIKQAIAAKADAVFTTAMDCPNISGALRAARKANVAVFGFAAYDCDIAEFGGGERLFTRTLNSRGSWTNWGTEYGKARAKATAAYMKGTGTLLALGETSSLASRTVGKAFRAQFKISCPKCKLVKVDWQFSQVPTAATQIWKSAILAHPDATALSNGTDAIISLGLMSAVQQSGRPNLPIYGSDGNRSNIALIREGKQASALTVHAYQWQAWGLADTANRYFAGSKNYPDEGGGWRLVDKDHLPAGGDFVEPTIDYRAAFKRIWTGK